MNVAGDAWPEPPPTEATDLPATGPASVAGIRARAIGRAIDTIILIVVVTASLAAGTSTDDGTTTIAGWSVAVILGFWYLYETLPIGLRGQTLGKRVVGVRCVDRATGEPPPLFRAGLRVLVVMLIFIVVSTFTARLGIGALGPAALVFTYGSAVAGGSLQLNIPDRVANTVVVNSR